jgi:pyruvate kinase
MLEKMIAAGMNFARLNFSHGTHESHRELIRAIRSAVATSGKEVQILQDLQGTKMRLGILPEEGVELKSGEIVRLDTSLTEYDGAGSLPLAFPGLEKHLAVGERILIDDGRLEIKIILISGTVIEARIVDGGVVTSHKGLNFPDSTLSSIPALSEKDKEDIAFAVNEGIDSMSLSFVKSARDIIELRQAITDAQKKAEKNDKIFIVGKIERADAVKNLDEIIGHVDALMVARGDLGLEMPQQELPITQKNIVRAANQAGIPVMVATQLLDSMQRSRRPSRAEVSDVANAVIDGADALLLTNETATGEFPVEAVETLSQIIAETEKSSYDDAVHPASEHRESLFA